MKFLADESVDRQVVDQLRLDGHEVWYVAEKEPGISDDTVLDRANQEMAVLLTADKDFGELVFRQKRIAMGVILLRLGKRQGSFRLRSIDICKNWKTHLQSSSQVLSVFAGPVIKRNTA